MGTTVFTPRYLAAIAAWRGSMVKCPPMGKSATCGWKASFTAWNSWVKPVSPAWIRVGSPAACSTKPMGLPA
ncbi:hypothetical protein D3C78_1895560 [compost metagenome]